jgi:NTP pyrophosphatase (non-canonical NTP hydrolase)
MPVYGRVRALLSLLVGEAMGVETPDWNYDAKPPRPSKTLKECQDEVNAWVSKRSCGYWNPHQIYTRLGSEVGELGKEINHEFGPLIKKEGEKPSSVTEECGDVIFTVICLLNSRGLSLDRAFELAMAKCYGRDKDRFSLVEPKQP